MVTDTHHHLHFAVLSSRLENMALPWSLSCSRSATRSIRCGIKLVDFTTPKSRLAPADRDERW